jgi:hypothetical protein
VNKTVYLVTSRSRPVRDPPETAARGADTRTSTQPATPATPEPSRDHPTARPRAQARYPPAPALRRSSQHGNITPHRPPGLAAGADRAPPAPPMDEPAIRAHSHKPEHNPPGVNHKTGPERALASRTTTPSAPRPATSAIARDVSTTSRTASSRNSGEYVLYFPGN